MKNKVLIIIVVTILIIVVFVFVTSRKVQNEMNEQLPPQSEDSGKNNGEIIDLTKQSEVIVTIKDFVYNPSNIKVKKGTKVTWVNQDTMEHNVMPEHEDDDAPHPAPTLEEVRSNVFAGPLLSKGESYSFIFNMVGPEPYHCSPHPYMKGMITVVE